MGRYDHRDIDTLREDLLIAWHHPDFRDMDTIDALRQVRQRRHNDWV